MAIEGLRQAKENRNKDEAQRDVLKNNKIQAEVSAKLRAERAKFEREQRNEANRVAIEGLRQAKDIRNKDENKEVALGTSKINYMDPRISVAWCKRNEVPIEQLMNALAEPEAGALTRSLWVTVLAG